MTIGYFARVAAEKGLHILADAFCLLALRDDLPPLRLHAAGYMSSGDRPYFDQIVRRLTEAGVADRFEYRGELDRAGKIAFLQSLDVMAVPTVYHESKGISVLEGMASGVPMVLPRHGTFPELIERSGGGPALRAARSAVAGRQAGRIDPRSGTWPPNAAAAATK